MTVRIKSVKKNFYDKALTIPTAIIQLMNADSGAVRVGCTGNSARKYLRERLTSGVRLAG